MKTTGTGRIVLWRGGSLWIGRAGEPTDFHSHHAVQITFSFSEDGVRFRRPNGPWNIYKAAIIAAHQVHAFEARGKFVAMIFVEPESREGRVLHQIGLEEGISSLTHNTLAHELAALAASYKEGALDSELAASARFVITKLAATNMISAVSLDKRIEYAVELLRENIGETVPLAKIADATCLSAERFRHLFIEQTGMRFRPYVLWLRIEIALTAFASGANLTEAAQAGGFADSAHFSRTFKRMFGIVPSSFQRE
ncbi:AraC family transcriptional regulator [Methylomonas rosea]|uniref:AraC family transcriptional regulator n=1 Tax=Methylomonas rosea TaxID=2952227 RepID=A0ABT1TXL2_9GAMM|nr:AraC family transcriptional regulator [Methylomonas sp. WSC-7]MCQ8119489.1 AraC family transcriptional regulator [Methylomonas sp. WSC-7]